MQGDVMHDVMNNFVTLFFYTLDHALATPTGIVL